MVLLHSLIAFASVAGVAHSQNVTSTVDPQDIDSLTKQHWCLTQTESCLIICDQVTGVTGETPNSNECDDDTLKYSCVCSNGQSPNASEYTETIPFFLCTEQNTQCVNDCTQNNSSCQDKCRSSNPCGAQNPRPPNKTATTAASTTSTLPPFTGEASDEGGAIKPMIDLKPVYGLSIVLGGFFAGFAFFL
ncbi:hypothetical protein ASPSYDRAFT_28737 [Aspergillus sydowii CBS 593.65]|uniref:DUF7707 domain-containing protein n=1 Tax=Aspergillus sydowii CBS 593.65 TaxID=1036612 RepID=A0A1L9TUN9_9EURO|nr:uncharacterized protein ASPSYDRAFT_28737 [Aspergillus sydowii CBS 593.65]OJJ63131.1 hypothetical protein ASPSYDRAFT_28737 [Aspergillus sydowii CBS 593.65]